MDESRSEALCSYLIDDKEVDKYCNYLYFVHSYVLYFCVPILMQAIKLGSWNDALVYCFVFSFVQSIKFGLVIECVIL